MTKKVNIIDGNRQSLESGSGLDSLNLVAINRYIRT
jgi:hypothetical protein